jgi:nucleotide-binding universal stress UspA family protein
MAEPTDPSADQGPPYPRIVVGFEPNERGEDAVALAEAVARTAGGRVERVHVERGSPARKLFELAERGKADLIVLGSTHRASLGRVAPGSVAEHLLNGARCRLAIAPNGYARARAELAGAAPGEAAGELRSDPPLPAVREELRVIGVGFDGTLESLGALAEAAVLARLAGASMRLIAVDAPAPRQLGPQGAAPPLRVGGTLQARLHDAAAGLPPELRALPVYLKGEPVEILLEQAGEGMDLLVLGSRGFGPVLRLLLGSVAGRVIRAAPCPVLVMPRLVAAGSDPEV